MSLTDTQCKATKPKYKANEISEGEDLYLEVLKNRWEVLALENIATTKPVLLI